MRVAFVIDPLQSLNVQKDTTLSLACSALNAGCQVFFMEAPDLFFAFGRVSATASRVLSIDRALHTVLSDSSALLTDYLSLAEPCLLESGDVDLVFMRKDPPTDSTYWAVTYLLRFWERLGVRVANSTQALREHNEKCTIGLFPELITHTLISAKVTQIEAFLHKHETIILKPLDSMGGEGIVKLHASDPLVRLRIYSATQASVKPVMAQALLDVVRTGDKRIIIIHGEPLPYALARYPAEGNFLANLAAGGSGQVVELTESERSLAHAVAKQLPIDELGFIGMDVIDDCITEINVTSPTCLRELQTHSGECYADAYIQGFLS